MENETEAATTIAGLASTASHPITNDDVETSAKRLKAQEFAKPPPDNDHDQSDFPARSFESPEKASKPGGLHTGTTPIGLFSPDRLSPATALSASEKLSASPQGSTLDGFDFDAALLIAETSARPQDAQNQQQRRQSLRGASSPQEKSLFGEGATLMENDLEAISALNSLSRSGESPSASVPDEKPRVAAAPPKKSKMLGKSLFAKVVDDANAMTKTRASKRKRGP